MGRLPDCSSARSPGLSPQDMLLKASPSPSASPTPSTAVCYNSPTPSPFGTTQLQSTGSSGGGRHVPAPCALEIPLSRKEKWRELLRGRKDDRGICRPGNREGSQLQAEWGCKRAFQNPKTHFTFPGRSCLTLLLGKDSESAEAPAPHPVPAVVAGLGGGGSMRQRAVGWPPSALPHR